MRLMAEPGSSWRSREVHATSCTYTGTRTRDAPKGSAMFGSATTSRAGGGGGGPGAGPPDVMISGVGVGKRGSYVGVTVGVRVGVRVGVAVRVGVRGSQV